MREQGEIIDIATCEDELKNITYRVTLEFKEKPIFRLGEADIKQKWKDIVKIAKRM